MIKANWKVNLSCGKLLVDEHVCLYSRLKMQSRVSFVLALQSCHFVIFFFTPLFQNKPFNVQDCHDNPVLE